eukprot:156537_1
MIHNTIFTKVMKMLQPKAAFIFFSAALLYLNSLNSIWLNEHTQPLIVLQTESKIQSDNVYHELNRTNELSWYHVAGGSRTGSTMLYNILRVLIREKIDPNVYNAYELYWQPEFHHTNYVKLSKMHHPCGDLEIHSTNYSGKIFISHRNVSQQICSAVRLMLIPSRRRPMKAFCLLQWNYYQSCLRHPWLVYDMSFERLITNMTGVIEDIAYILNITHVMNKYDYNKITNELNHLVSPNNGIHPITELHGNHVTKINDSSVTSKKCDVNYVIKEIIKKTPKCNAYYEFVNTLLLNEH